MAEKEIPELIWVIAHPRAADRVALSDRDPNHPLNEYGQHEVFVAHGTGPVQVSLNAEVMRRLAPSDGELLRVDGPLLEAAREKHRLTLDAKKAERERILLVEKQERMDAIDESNRRANDLQLKLAELEERFERRALAQSAQNDADASAARHQAAVDQAKAMASGADDGPVGARSVAPSRNLDPDVATRREARRQRASANSSGVVVAERPRR